MELALHRLRIEIIFMVRRLLHAHGLAFGLATAVLIFSVIFLIVGILRVVEFHGHGFSPRKLKMMMSAHVVGVILFSAAMALFGLDIYAVHLQITGAILFSSLAFLLPVHIYLGLLRRVRTR